MANTVISLKKSSTPSATPVSLANGELAINYADGIIYYKAANGTIASISSGTPSFGTINSGGTLVVADAVNDVFDIRAGQNIIITGDAINDRMTLDVDLTAANSWANTKLSNGTVTLAGALTTTGQVTANSQINITPTGGDEGGEIQLQGPGDYTDWSIDSYQNNFRVFTVTGSTVSNINFFHAGAGSIRMGVNKTDPAYAVDVTGDVNVSGKFRINGTEINTGGTTDLTPANNWANTLSVTDRAIANDAANSANSYAESIGLSSNNYAVQVAAAANNWANTKVDYVVGTAGEIFVTNGDDYNPTINLISTGVVAATYGSATQIPTFVVDGLGRLTYAANVTVQGMDYPYTNAVGVSANSYADSVGNAGNNYTNAVGTAGNNYTNAVGLASNNYADFIGISGNNYTNAVGAASNTWANNIGVSANNYANSVGLASNNYTNDVGLAGNNYTIFVGAAANNYANNTFFEKIGGDITGSVNVAGNFTITGNLRVSGNTSFISVDNYRVDDPLIYLAANNYTSDIVDIGFIANYVNTGGANVHTGLYREHVDKEWYLFQGYDKEPINNHIGALSNNMTLAVLNADLRTSNLNLGGANAIVWINSLYGYANGVANASNAYGDSSFTTLANGISAFNHANSAYAKANSASGGGYYQGNNGDVGSASGLGDIFRVHSNTLTENVTIYSGNNAICAGPITVATGKTLTIQTGARVVIS